ncbi:hypothetical protein BTR22_18990 [Alkalihalophilus pseudofirmus]|uniref:protein-export chaperone SecB n=1 Tax=Alkalihalophilus pseudofirmus TaxID=79885 RepID=UPI0009535742|nr:hypothetical protein BTR22_18990 [Alkalihalophilus pseudofirmus]
MKASLQFKDYHVIETIYRFDPFFEPEDDTVSPSFEFEIEYGDESKTAAWLTLSTEMGDPNLKSNSVFVKVSIVGYFEIDSDENVSVDDLISLYKINGVAILYPYLRAQVSDLTGKGNEQSIILPTLNIVEVMKSYE